MSLDEGERLSKATMCLPPLSWLVHVSRLPPRVTSTHHADAGTCSTPPMSSKSRGVSIAGLIGPGFPYIHHRHRPRPLGTAATIQTLLGLNEHVTPEWEGSGGPEALQLAHSPLESTTALYTAVPLGT